jgi:hypothetical protein
MNWSPKKIGSDTGSIATNRVHRSRDPVIENG